MSELVTYFSTIRRCGRCDISLLHSKFEDKLLALKFKNGKYHCISCATSKFVRSYIPKDKIKKFIDTGIQPPFETNHNVKTHNYIDSRKEQTEKDIEV